MTEHSRLSAGLGFYSLGAVLLAAAYLLTFVQLGLSLDDAAQSSIINVGAAYVLGVAVCYLTSMIRPAAWPVRFSVHLLGAVAFAWGWYGVIRLVYALVAWLASGVFTITPFPPSVLTWQICQGLVMYSLLASASYAFSASVSVSGVGAADDDDPRSYERLIRRFLTRRGEVIEPIDVDEIISVSGADDYSEVSTQSGRHLVRISLNEFERRLEPSQFLRVHRSKIINFKRLISAEPAGGGRFLLHLEGGEAVHVSRAGAQRLKQHIF